MALLRQPQGIILLLAMIMLCPVSSSAQLYDTVYRDPGLVWQELHTDRFRIVYPRGEEASAQYTARLLHEHYGMVQTYTGGSLHRFPVVLNADNDLSNGYVTTLHFRMEVEIPRMKGKFLNPADGNWLNSVVPHELVHAMHFNVLPTGGLSWMLRPFSPDGARSMHFAAPTGMLEGVAVYHESHHGEIQTGRAHHAWFTGAHKAVFQSDMRWSLSRSLMSPVAVFPFNRHYAGGYHFVNWLQNEYGKDITKNSIAFVSKYPFLGYGVALRSETGKWPSALHRKYQADMEKHYSSREYSQTINAFPSADGISIHNSRGPVWLTNQTLLFYGKSYDNKAGFYTYETQNATSFLLLETGTVEDYLTDVATQPPRFLYSRYHIHPRFDNVAHMHVYEVSLQKNPLPGLLSTPKLVCDNTSRIHAPVYSSDGSVWALQTRSSSNQLVRISDEGTDTLLVPGQDHFVSVSFHPAQNDTLLLLANRRGLQGIWILDSNELQSYHDRPPDLAFTEASIYDAVWHTDGTRIVFVSDLTGTKNLYEYHMNANAVYRRTDHPYGIFEPSVSPDGSQWAAIQFNKNRNELVILNDDELPRWPLDQALYDKDFFYGNAPYHDQEQHAEFYSVKPYKTGFGWLRPRSVTPFFDDELASGRLRGGIELQSGDLLRKHSYSTVLSGSNNRFWQEVTWRYTGRWPGFGILFYNRPVSFTTGPGKSTGARFEVPVRYRFEADTRLQSLIARPGIGYGSVQQMSEDGTLFGPQRQRLTASLFVSYQHRLHRNIRSVQPDAGWLIFADTERYLYENSTNDLLSALRTGFYRYNSLPFFQNQSMRTGLEFMTQNRAFHDITGFFSKGFEDHILLDSNTTIKLGTRITTPLWFADSGSVTLPFFLDLMYLVLFTETLIPLSSGTQADLINNSRSLAGAGLRWQFRMFNIPFDVGLAAIYEPSRRRSAYVIGPF